MLWNPIIQRQSAFLFEITTSFGGDSIWRDPSLAEVPRNQYSPNRQDLRPVTYNHEEIFEEICLLMEERLADATYVLTI